VWRNNFGTSPGLGGGGGAGAVARSVDVAIAKSAVMETVAEESPESPAAIFVTFDDVNSLQMTDRSSAVDGRAPNSQPTFDNLLLAATRHVESQSSATLDDVFAELSAESRTTDSELLALLAGDALGLPNLPL
jgi:hypothetical protein